MAGCSSPVIRSATPPPSSTSASPRSPRSATGITRPRRTRDGPSPCSRRWPARSSWPRWWPSWSRHSGPPPADQAVRLRTIQSYPAQDSAGTGRRDNTAMTEAEGSAQIGVTGLAVMGRNLARNLAGHRYRVAVHNRSPERTRALIAEHGHEGSFVPADTMAGFVAALGRPRAIIIMVKAGEPTDAVISELVPLLEPGDIVIDCGNAHFADTRRRERDLRGQHLHFVGTGVSGGEEGALHGPSIMPGGSAESYRTLGPIFTSIAANVDGTPCCTHVGPDGAGHFVKMVHNGIEYADMQLIAEAYDLLRAGLGATPAEVGEIFRTWNEGDLDSFLIKITAEVLAHEDAATGKPFVDVVLDQAEQKGTGRWTVQSALDLGVPITGIAEATFARSLSGHVAQRAAAREAFGSDAKPLEGID